VLYPQPTGRPFGHGDPRHPAAKGLNVAKAKGTIISDQISSTGARQLPDRSKASTALLALTRHSLEEDKAEDVVVIDLKGKSAFADYMVIASGRSNRQVVAIAEHLADRLKQAGHGYIPVEGKQTGDWVLVDGGDVVVHIFRPEPRAFYALEKMWALDEETADAKAAKPEAARSARTRRPKKPA
jgi:ribosome silencing factor RsfS/YbeB/iojap